MLPDRVLNPGPLTYESGALPIAHLTHKSGVLGSIPGLTTYFLGTLFESGKDKVLKGEGWDPSFIIP